ncbi:hypothetical protein G9A89_006375 [Geosiphon pyriformis]|nr:hypothetical protein G9A89_006375 [Geosiphon pyriformis]
MFIDFGGLSFRGSDEDIRKLGFNRCISINFGVDVPLSLVSFEFCDGACASRITSV